MVLACGACDYYTDPTTDEATDDPDGGDSIDDGLVQYQLIESAQIAGAGQIAGITWLASQASNRLVVLDADGTERATARTDLLDPGWN